ncbi:unnamed protein product [Angiostrongylus costaricensis]|uniref:KTSC domain-containing protein n=1 Tax=Angiostrongylus costaricensis TaxID=334426 RepID=A0A158PKR6_ANGCS|nr:unnamed protein product [Angiostrongylus costaricensis]
MFYLQSYKFFDNLSSDVIRRFFTASERVHNSLDTLFKIQPKRNALNVCIHIRRGDMTNSTESLASDDKFTSAAVKYVHDKASVSTFGYWIGYLSRGQRVYYNYDFTREHGIETQLVPTDFWPPHWIALKYNTFDGEVIEWSSVN